MIINIFTLMINNELLEYLQGFLTPRRKKLFEKVINQRTNHFTVVAQDVYQLHNTSAVIRSCDVFGIQNVQIIEEKLPQRIDKEIAMGAQKWVNVNRFNSTKDCLAAMRKKGYRIVATSPHYDSTQLTDMDISIPSAIFFGTERDGLSNEVLDQADYTLHIPMVGFTESLNISVSAAIILQDLTQRLRNSEVKWQLSDSDKRELKFLWTTKTIKNSKELIEKFLNR